MINDNIPLEATDYFLYNNLDKELNEIWNIGETKGYGAAREYWDDYVLKNKDKMFSDLIKQNKASMLKEATPIERTFYGTPSMWEGELKPDSSRYLNSKNNNYSLNRFSTTADLETAKKFMQGNSMGDVYAFDVSPDDFYRVDKPFSQQSPKVQQAIISDITKNPNSLFGLSGAPKYEGPAHYSEIGDALNKYGILGEYNNNEYTFTNPEQVPTGYATQQGLVTQGDLPTIGRVPTKGNPIPTYTKQPTLEQILREIAIEKNLQSATNDASHGSGALFYKYDPKYAYTGEGAQVYSKGMYTGSIPEIGDYYRRLAERKGKKGYLYKVDLPDQYKYYNTDLPSSQQSPWVTERLASNLYPEVSAETLKYEPLDSKRFANLYDDFYKEFGRVPNNTDEVVSFVNKNIRKYPKELFPSLGATDYRFNELDKLLKGAGVPGTTHYKPNGSHVNITYNPNDINIYALNEIGKRKYAISEQVNKTLSEMLKGYRKAFNPINRLIIQNPYTKPVLKALGTTLGAIGTAGDALFVGDTLYKSSNFYPENTERDRQYRQDLSQGKRNPLVTRGVGMRQEDLGLLPNIQVNSDGSPNVTLQGRVVYDDYMLEPLGDDVYIRRKNNQ